MDAQEILARARSPQELPNYWHVWPLRRDYIVRSILKWLAASLLGFVLLIPAVFSTVPGNFERGQLAFLVTSILLLLLGAVAFGALAIAIYDCWRLLHADDYLLVMTPDDYVKAEPRGKVTHVPMENIGYITLRGPKSALTQTNSVYGGALSMPQGGVDRLMHSIAAANERRQKKQTPTLAFVDLRTDREVVVATDNSFDELAALEYVLSLQLDENAKQRRGGG